MKNTSKSILIVGFISLITANLKCFPTESKKTLYAYHTIGEAPIIAAFNQWLESTAKKFFADITVQKDSSGKQFEITYSKELCALEKAFKLKLFEFKFSYTIKFFTNLMNSSLKNIQTNLTSENLDKSEEKVRLWALGLAASEIFYRLYPVMFNFSFRNHYLYCLLFMIAIVPNLIAIPTAIFANKFISKKQAAFVLLFTLLPFGLAANMVKNLNKRKEAFLSDLENNKCCDEEKICLWHLTMPDGIIYKPWEMFEAEDSFSVQKLDGMPFELTLIRNNKPYAKGITLDILLGNTSQIYTDNPDDFKLRVAETCHNEYNQILKKRMADS